MLDSMNLDRRRFLGAAAMTIAGGRLTGFDHGAPMLLNAASESSADDRMPSLAGATAWINSGPLTPDGLRGKVVLVQFLTYSCINWLRTLPYIRAWAERYADPGLVVLGVHTPEFPFEHDLDNVRRALRELKFDLPIAVDNDYAVWRAFANAYWPALYFVDARGRVRHQHFGEGEYESSERVLLRLLTEAGAERLPRDTATAQGHGVEAAADWQTLRSPEAYIGSDRADALASPGGAAPGRRRIYAAPARLRRNEWALSGDWTVGRHAAVLNEAGGRLVHRFHARDLHLVMGAATQGRPARFRVRLDGHEPGPSRGLDVDEHGDGVVSDPRLYQLVRQVQPVADRTFEIEFVDGGAEAFSFTFG
jgi:hypothetical protein